jgi:hypothetical protein
MLLSEVDDHRALIHGITTLAETDLTSYAVTLMDESPDRVAAQLRAASGAVISSYGQVAATSGALFYETNRPAPGFTADLVAPTIGDDVASALGWAFAPLFNPDQFPNGPLETIPRLAGVAQRFIASADRETVRAASQRDNLSTGVASFARQGTCAFCSLLSAQGVRGGHWHNGCKCVDVPTWNGAPAPSSQVRDEQTAAAHGAIAHLDKLRADHPDLLTMRPRQFLAAHPELVKNNKNITRVMRELYGFAH